MPRILILVLSYNSPPFDTLMRVQQETFDSVEVEGVKTIYYHGGYLFDETNWQMVSKIPRYWFRRVKHNDWSETLKFKCTDEYYYMAAKFVAALEYINDLEYDFIFRTNSSSYVNKKELVEFAKTLPKEKLYSGWEFIDSEDFGGGCVSGAGIWLTPDTAKILMDNIDPNFEQEEDVYCGRILRKHGIVAIDDKSRYDVETFHPFIPLDKYHYRFKTGNRLIDAHNMVMLHKKIISQ